MRPSGIRRRGFRLRHPVPPEAAAGAGAEVLRSVGPEDRRAGEEGAATDRVPLDTSLPRCPCPPGHVTVTSDFVPFPTDYESTPSELTLHRPSLAARLPSSPPVPLHAPAPRAHSRGGCMTRTTRMAVSFRDH